MSSKCLGLGGEGFGLADYPLKWTLSPFVKTKQIGLIATKAQCGKISKSDRTAAPFKFALRLSFEPGAIMCLADSVVLFLIPMPGLVFNSRFVSTNYHK
jgi:hypothetical protein